jgi:membrane carboxypeptidase/penicillin-binding protein
VYSLIGVLGVFGVFGLIGLTFAISTSAGLSFLAQMEADLPPVSNFERADFAQPTVVYDRTGTVELARFQIERRHVVTYEAIPKVLLDATIAVEDQTFWDNEGYDPNAIVSAARSPRRGRPRRLDHHPAAGAGATSPGGRAPGRPVDAQDQEFSRRAT